MKESEEVMDKYLLTFLLECIGTFRARSGVDETKDLDHAEAFFSDTEDVWNRLVGSSLKQIFTNGQKDESYVAGRDLVNEWINYNPNQLPDSQTHLRNIFDQIKPFGQSPPNTEASFFPFASLKLHEDRFPAEAPRDIKSYQQLYIDFVEGFRKLPTGNSLAFINTLLNMMATYWSFLPAGKPPFEDVALYDLTKTRLMLFHCVMVYCLQNKKSPKELKDTEKPFCFIAGDLSGIQKFIYDIDSKYAAKNLKGRSFYLQLLVDGIIEQINNSFELFGFNTIYGSGGGFYLLAPSRKDDDQRLSEVKKKAEDYLFKEHGIDLFLAIGSHHLSCKQIAGPTSDYWDSLSKKLIAQKRQKFSSKLQEDYSSLFEPFEVNTDLRDEVDGQHVNAETQLQRLEGHPSDEKVMVKHITQEILDLGKNLRQTEALLVGVENPNDSKTFKAELDCDMKGLAWNFLIPSHDVKKYPHSSLGSHYNLRWLNEPEAILQNDPPKELEQLSRGFDFYGGNQAPTNKENGDLKTFDELAEDTYLGVLRMDVDNLGSIFISGLMEQKRTLAHYTTLSRQLDFFFKGYLNRIWSENPEYRELTYILYAGGDDLFIVGRWDLMLQFAREVQIKFKEWVNYHPGLSLSGGLAIVTRKFPISKAAGWAGDAEEAAKNHTWNNQEKNSFCFLDHPLNWEYEFPFVEGLKNTMVGLYQQKQVPRGFFQRLQMLNAQRIVQQKNKANPKWRWHMAYQMGRLRQQYSKQEDFVALIEEIQKAVITGRYQNADADWQKGSKYNYMDLLALAARWAEMETKMETNLS